MQEIAEVKNELLNIADYENQAVALFENDQVADVTTQLEEYCSSVVHDISTDKGKKELKQFVARIKKSGKLLDDLGKEHTGKLKALPKIVDQSRKGMRDRIELLAIKVREPLTAWEDAEEKRKNSILERINAIDPFQGGMITIEPGERTTASLKDLAETASLFEIDDSLDEFQETAKKKRDDIILKLSGLIAIQMQQEAAAKLAEKQRIEQEAQEQQEREERIAKEAAEKAKLEAEQKAEAEKQAILDREQKAKEAAEQAERERIASEERAKIEQELAVKAEQDKHIKEQQAIKDKADAERKAAEKKAANKKHRARINNAILAHLSELDGSPESAKKFIERIVKGEIPELTVNY